MTKMIGRNRNTTDTASISGPIEINASTSVVLAPANPRRIYFEVNNDNSPQNTWIKLQAASTDNDKKGILLGGRSSWEMQSDNVYTGEISAIGDVSSSDIYVTEY